MAGLVRNDKGWEVTLIVHMRRSDSWLFAAVVVLAAKARLLLAAARGRAALDLLLDLARDQAGAGDSFLDRLAADHGAGRLVRDLLHHHDLIFLGLLLGDTLPGAHLDLLLLVHGLVDGDLAGDGLALANVLHAGDRALDPDLARHPDLDGLGLRTAVVAAILAAQALQAVAERGLAGHFTAFPVALVDALLDHHRDRLAAVGL